MTTLRIKRKLAAVSRETPESNRNSRGQNTLDPESTQDCISQVSEEIEGRVTQKLSKEFSRTESRILGALSKLDEFLLNPQVRTCSVAVPGTSRNNNSENRETTGDRSSHDPCPEVMYSSSPLWSSVQPRGRKLPSHYQLILWSFKMPFSTIFGVCGFPQFLLGWKNNSEKCHTQTMTTLDLQKLLAYYARRGTSSSANLVAH